MNAAKARDHFSAYYEKSLDRGLLEAFERCLKSEPGVAAEYRAFERTMEGLSDWAKRPIEPSVDLHERISAKVDLAVWNKSQAKPASLTAWLRGLAFAGTAAVLFGVLWYQMRPTGDAITANLVPGQGAVSGLRIGVEDGRVMLSYPGLTNKTVTIRDESGEVLETVRLRSEEIKDKLIGNASAKPKLMSIEVPGDAPVYVAIPGNQRSDRSDNKGTLRDLAKAFAGFYRTPVVLSVTDAEALAEWNYDTDELKAAQDAVGFLELQVELRDSNVLWIQSQ